MRVGVTCPNLQFAAGNENSEAEARRLMDLGFPIQMREVPGGTLLCPEGIIYQDLMTMEDLVALQELIGYPLKLHPGPYLEIQSV